MFSNRFQSKSDTEKLVFPREKSVPALVSTDRSSVFRGDRLSSNQIAMRSIVLWNRP
jgi:hypothetical protein